MNIKKLYTKIIIVLILLVIINMGLLFCFFITPMQIQGDSMEPNYKNGRSFLLIRLQTNLAI